MLRGHKQGAGNNVKAIHIVAVQSLRIPRFGAEGERRHVNQPRPLICSCPNWSKYESTIGPPMDQP